MNGSTRELELLSRAIEALPDATLEEKDALHEILDIEGFGGREEQAISPAAARELAESKLEWYREERAR